MKNYFMSIIKRHTLHYDYNYYWKRRTEVINPNSKYSKIIRLFWLWEIRKCDVFYNAYMGTEMGRGAAFDEPPILPHLLNGIVVSCGAKIGKHCVIYQQVTIGEKNHEYPKIGDNCNIGAGAKIIGGVTIGDNVKVGANAVVINDIPSNSIAVGVPARVILNKNK